MPERFSISTIVEENRLYYKVYDNESGKTIECNVGELNKTIWKLLGV